MTTIKRLCFLLFLVTITSACDQGGSNDDGDKGINVNDTASLAGTYDLISITSKSNELFGVGTVVTAGQVNVFTIPSELGDLPVAMEISGTVTFTTTTYATNFDITISLFGETESEVDQESGTYSVSNSQMTTASSSGDDEDDLIGSGAITMSASGMDLTLENAELSMLLRKR